MVLEGNVSIPSRLQDPVMKRNTIRWETPSAEKLTIHNRLARLVRSPLITKLRYPPQQLRVPAGKRPSSTTSHGLGTASNSSAARIRKIEPSSTHTNPKSRAIKRHWKHFRVVLKSAVEARREREYGVANRIRHLEASRLACNGRTDMLKDR